MNKIEPVQKNETARLAVDLGERGYDILIGSGLITTAGEHIAGVIARPRVVIVTDETVATHWLAPLQQSLDAATISHQTIVLPAGEQTKDFSHFTNLLEQILELKVDRRTTLVALGGGVVGDITGFAAAVTLRGLAFIQIPTTLLAQVDSSVGGKTGINAPQGKNLIGAFHQPRLVLSDTGALDTLSPREIRAGYAEVVKYGIIDDAPFFDWLDANGPALLAGDDAARRYAVLTSCQNKARVVADDEREVGRRALLNLGHTFGHALERQTGFGERLLHGEAVALGMLMALDLSVELGLCPATDRERTRQHLASVGLPTDLSTLADASWSADLLLDHMTLDKKVVDGHITFILAKGIGKAFIADNVDVTCAQTVLGRYLATP